MKNIFAGAILTEYWKRETRRLAYEWDTSNFVKVEPNRIEYTCKANAYNKDKSSTAQNTNYYPEYIKYLKTVVSALVLLFMVILIALDIAIVVIFRIYFKKFI